MRLLHESSDTRLSVRIALTGSRWTPVLGFVEHEYEASFFFISNFRRVLNLVCILLGVSPASDYGLPTFRNTLSVPSSKAGCEV